MKIKRTSKLTSRFSLNLIISESDNDIQLKIKVLTSHNLKTNIYNELLPEIGRWLEHMFDLNQDNEMISVMVKPQKRGLKNTYWSLGK